MTTDRPRPQDQRRKTMQARIIRAAIACLDTLGYAETSFARIQTKAGVSRGAITHHFPTKQALVAATAMELLANALEPVEQGAPVPVRDLILTAWDRVVNSSGGRAMVEILVACRTDTELHHLLADHLHDWDRQSRASIAASYKGHDAGDAELLWSITRSFLRGLILHEKFVDDPADMTRMVDRFARLMETQLTPRTTEETT
ncbi:MAG: TetR/AcrR family transcriptional regulator [Ruegeria sp.]|uniref:TetR/AcrR family transcriptional regulator n=1 Tax=Ruegeria sp. TaxID=1879320 RepID=UPI00349E9939